MSETTGAMLLQPPVERDGVAIVRKIDGPHASEVESFRCFFGGKDPFVVSGASTQFLDI